MANAAIPLCVDCDGTLVRTDLLHEAVFMMLKSAPWKLLLLPLWWLRGKAYLKERIAESVSFDWSTIPLNDDIVTLVRAANDEGRKVILATASHQRLADGLATHLQLFTEVVATRDGVDMTGRKKAAWLVSQYGERGFDYAGNARADLPVWSVSRSATVVSSSPSLIEAARKIAQVDRVIPIVKPRLSAYVRAMRLHQWLKNLLLLVPLLAAHRLGRGDDLANAGLGFLAFGLCASTVYVFNDLLDLPADRLHARKRTRPFASALVPVWHGAVMIPLLLMASFYLASRLPIAFSAVLATYFALTLSYSILLKRQVVVDVIMLAGLYTIRVIAGGAATGIVPSFWLLAFSMFMFLSLALVKRYSELLESSQKQKSSAFGRGYWTHDLPVLLSAGTSSGMVAVLVIALYINSPETRSLYANPAWLWFVPPLLLYWVTRVWMKAHRGEIDDDPVVFAARDWQSLLILVLCALLFSLAHSPEFGGALRALFGAPGVHPFS
ncbi:MAG: UbiA family prenyltransferase [Rhizobacter sp.]